MSSSTITVEELRVFHTLDRRIYARLLIDLKLESSLCKKILGFWMWLERGLRRYFMKDMLCLPDKWLYGLAKEAVICFHFMSDDPFSSILARTNQQLLYMPALISQDFCLGFLYSNRDVVKAKVQKIVEDVCEKAFSDIDGLRGSTQMSNRSLNPALFLTRPVEPMQELVQRSTLMVTLFNGCPSLTQQLEYFLTSVLGNCVERMYTKMGPKIRFAGILVNSSKAIRGILANSEVAHFFYDGVEFSVTG